MREVDTQALQLVAPSLGIGNPATARSAVDFDDGVLQQVYDVSGLIRRGESPFQPDISTGLLLIELDAATPVVVWDPYNPDNNVGLTLRDDYPNREEMRRFDVWLVGPGSVFMAAGTGPTTDADSSVAVQLRYDSRVVTNTGPGVAGGLLAAFKGPAIQIAAGGYWLPKPGPDGDVAGDSFRAIRINPGVRVQYLSSQSAAGTDVFQVTHQVALFPRGTGQDVVS